MPPGPDVTLSKIEVPDPSQAIADGSSQLGVRVTLFSSGGAPLVGVVPELLVVGEGSHVVSCATTDSSGVSYCTVKTPTPGQKAFIIKDVPLINIATALFHNPNSSVEAPMDPAPANGQQTISVELSLRDLSNQPIVGVIPTLEIEGEGTNTVDCQPSDANGKAICLIRSDTPGPKTVRIIDSPVLSQSTIVFSSPLLLATRPRAKTGGGSPPESAPEDQSAEVQVNILSGSGAGVAGVTPVLNITGGGTNAYTCGTSDSSGAARCQITSDAVGQKIVAITTPGDITETIILTFANPFGSISTVEPGVAVLANGIAEAAFDVQLFQNDGTPLSEASPRLDVIGNGQKSTRCEVTDATGLARCWVSSTEPGIKTVVVLEPPVAAQAEVEFKKASLILERNFVPAGSGPIVIAVDVGNNGSVPELDLIGDLQPAWQCVPPDDKGISRCFLTSETSGRFDIKVSTPVGIADEVSATFVDGRSSMRVVVHEAPADGMSTAQIELSLKNSLGLPRIGITPQLHVTGDGTSSYTCSATSVLGVSTCTVTSQTPGTKQVQSLDPLLNETAALRFDDVLSSLEAAAAGSLDAIAGVLSSKAQVKMTLISAGGSPREGIVPILSVTGAGNYSAFCSPSDATGISICDVAADTAGEKTLSVFSPFIPSSLTLNFLASTKSCTIANGTGSQAWTGPSLTDWGSCTLVSCDTNYSPSGNACVADSRSCDPMPAHATTGTQTWTGLSWGSCSVSTCESGYKLVANACEAMDLTPDPFDFVDKTALELAQVETSGVVSVAGFEGALIASVSGADAQIRNATASSGWDSSVSVASGDLIELRMTSASTYDTQTLATLKLGTATADWSLRTRIADSAPDAFSLSAKTGVATNTAIESDTVTVTGFEGPLTASVSGGDAQIRNVTSGSAWSSSVDVSPSQQIQLKVTSSASSNTSVSVSLSFGTSTIDWVVSTAANSAPDAFAFTDQSNVEPGSVVTSDAVAVSGFDGPVSATCSAGCTLDRNASGSFSASVSGVMPGDTIRIRVTASASYSTSVNATAKVGATSSSTWSVLTRAQDVTPDAFSFTDLTAVEPSASVTSDEITLSGFEGLISVSAANGAEVSINGGAFTALATGVAPGDKVKVKITASASTLSAVTTTVAAGSGSTIWSITTRAPDTTPDAFDFTDQTISTNTLVSSNIVTVTGFDGSLTATATNGLVRNVTGNSSWNTSVSLAAGDQIQLQTTSSATAGGTVTVAVEIGSATVDWVVTADLCPVNFVFVPKLTGYTTQDFCVAKFEMRIQGQSNGQQTYNAAFVAESSTAGTPWTNISTPQAVSECQALGTGFDLINNEQWQTVARNIESVASNWSSGVVGTGAINTGHSDKSPGQPVGISDVNDPYSDTGNTAETSWSQKRTHTLSTGGVIWDLAGNTLERVQGTISSDYGGDYAFISQVTDTNHPVTDVDGRTLKAKFGPAGDYTSLNSGDYGGLGVAYMSVTGNYLRRGGYWSNNSGSTLPGIFSITRASGTTGTVNDGFRCVYVPQ